MKARPVDSEIQRKGRTSHCCVNLNSKINKHILNSLLILNALSFLSQRADMTSDKDMYLDNSSIEEASGVYPIDDDDYASASGSGKAAAGSLSLCMCTHTLHYARGSVQGS